MITTNNSRYGVDFISQQESVRKAISEANKKTMENKKPTLETVKTAFRNQELKLLSDSYINNRSKLAYQCLICDTCGEITYDHVTRGQGCNSLKCINIKRFNTCHERFGSNSPLQNQEIKNKAQATILARYGVDHVMQNAQIRDKAAATNLLRFGKVCALQSEVIQAKIRQDCFDKYGVDYHIIRPDVKERIKKTVFEKYGVEHYLQTTEFKAKLIATNMEKYGVPYPMMNLDVQNKSIATFQSKHGVKNASQVAEVQEKKMTTSRDRYNTDYPMQDPTILERSQKNSKTLKTYTMPSGKDIVVQGWENLALDRLLVDYDEDDILNERTSMPEIWYTENDGRYRRYICDFFIPEHNLIIEVKSTYTYHLEFNKNDVKRKACEYAGYRFRLMLFDDRRRLISVCA